VKLRERLEHLILSVPSHLEDLHDLQVVLVVGGRVSVLYVLLQHLELIRVFLENLREREREKERESTKSGIMI
jgi:hypothetical protein